MTTNDVDRNFIANNVILNSSSIGLGQTAEVSIAIKNLEKIDRLSQGRLE